MFEFEFEFLRLCVELQPRAALQAGLWPVTKQLRLNCRLKRHPTEGKRLRERRGWREGGRETDREMVKMGK